MRQPLAALRDSLDSWLPSRGLGGAHVSVYLKTLASANRPLARTPIPRTPTGWTLDMSVVLVRPAAALCVVSVPRRQPPQAQSHAGASM